MGKLTERLKDAKRSGVYRATRVDEVEDAVRGTRHSFARLALQGVHGKEALLAAIARELAFPQWFGGNWDALEDCLADLSWREAEGHVIVFEAFAEVGADDLGILIDILSSSAGFWEARGRAFFAVFVDPARALALPDLFRER
jgi:hypothetical protein